MRLLHLLAPASAAVIPVMDWSLDYGYCKAASPYLRREQLEPVYAEIGDVVDVRYARDGDMSGHDVRSYPDEASWLACDEAQSTLLSDGPAAGGNCSSSAAGGVRDCVQGESCPSARVEA